jgi:predicted AlkP superfamily pyrophosphatase or phosphodiesterase
MPAKHVIVINAVGLPNDPSAQRTPNIRRLADNGTSLSMIPSFPAVTCSVQATLTTGKYPREHGIIGNGFMDRDNYQVSFWEQNARLVRSERIWEIVKKNNESLKTAVLFWQNTLFTNSDVVVTPKPIHLDNEVVFWCYSKPVGFYEEIAKDIGEFDLRSYWGPLASRKSSEWITKCAMLTIEKHKPNLLLMYLPQVDYSAQKFGPDSPEANSDIGFVDQLVGQMVSKTEELGIAKDTVFIILSEYSFNKVSRSVSLNVKLRDANLLAVRKINGKEYIDYEHCKAFAMADHQFAHVYVKKGYLDETKSILNKVEGVSRILDDEGKKAYKIDNDRSGELIAIADNDCWFNYYWWYDSNDAPAFAKNVDIHRKPGYDPLELFFDPRTKGISMDTDLIKGSHGADTRPVPVVIGRNDPKSKQESIDATQIAPTIARLLGQ